MAHNDDHNSKPTKPRLTGGLANYSGSDKGPPTQKGAGGLSMAMRKTSVATTEGPKRLDMSATKTALVTSVTTQENVVIRDKKSVFFLFDATQSREATWKEAQRIQGRLFDSVAGLGLQQIGVTCHLDSKVIPLGWFDNAASARRAMSKIKCVQGGTRVVDGLYSALSSDRQLPPSSIVMVGDDFEPFYDSIDGLKKVCSTLAEKGVKIFAFHEQSDTYFNDAGQSAYKLAAELTGGVFKPFGENTDFSLGELCEAAMVIDIGGREAFQRLLNSGHKGAKALQTDVKKISYEADATRKPFIFKP